MNLKSLFVTATLAMAITSQAFYDTSYTFKFSDPTASYTVSNVYLLERRDDPVNGFSYGFRLPGSQVFAPFGGTITNYANILERPATHSLIIAMTDELPNDATGQKHVLLGMNSTSATYAAGIAWGTLFRNTQEETIIAALENYVNSEQAIRDAALQSLVNFAYGDAQTGILDNLAESQSAWFTTGGDFSLMTWSDGLVVGSGTSSQVQTVPEPASTFALGAGALGLWRKRRAKRTETA